MLWTQAGNNYSAEWGEYSLRVWLDPRMKVPTAEGELGSDEHPFVWFYEVIYEDGTVDFRGLRETLDEAKQAATVQVRNVQPDDYQLAEGF